MGSMLEQLEWPTLKRRRKNARLAMLYKIRNNLAVVETTEKTGLIPNERERRGPHNEDYKHIQTKYDYRKFSFLPRTVREWNALPEEAVTAPTLQAFASRVANLPK